MDTNQFLEHILPRQGIYMAVGMKMVPGKNGKDELITVHRGCHELKEMLRWFNWFEDNGFSTYHACASYKQCPYTDESGKKINRKSVNWLYARSLWVDIDCGEKKAEEGKGYTTQRDAMMVLVDFVKAYRLPKPTVISSGNGLHAYFVMDEDLTPEEWQPMSMTLKGLLEHHGVLADPSRTADFASVLRPVGTVNRKDPANPKLVTKVVDGVVVPAQKLKEHLNMLSEKVLGKLPPKPDFLNGVQANNIELNTAYPVHKYSADACADKCKQIAAMRDTLGDVNYDHWRGVIGLITFCEEGIDLAHAWSEKREETGHTNLDVDTRFNSWDAGPTTCEYFQRCNPEGCDGCPHRGSISTPLQLGVLDDSATKTEDAPVGESFPNGYEWKEMSDGSHAMIRWVEDDEGNKKAIPFCAERIYVVCPLSDEHESHSYQLSRYDVRTNKRHTFSVSGAAVFTGGNKLFETLGNSGVLPINSTQQCKAAMTAYLVDSINKIKRLVDTTRTYSSFGWHDDGFLLGNTLYMPDGTSHEVALSGVAATRAEDFVVSDGTIEGFAEGINGIYNVHGMEPYQYVICSLWGSLLAKFIDEYNGIPCAFVANGSGMGKTATSANALYAFGNAERMRISTKDGATNSFRMALMGAYKNLPLHFDEMTNLDKAELSQFLYSTSSGQDRGRARINGNGEISVHHQNTWSIHTVVTANDMLTSRIAKEGDSQGETMRVFEICIDKYKSEFQMVSKQEYVTYKQKLMNNRGVPGLAFIKYLLKNQESLPERLLAYQTNPTIDSNNSNSDDRYRFYRAHVACTMVAAEIMKELGVIAFDIDRLWNCAVRLYKELCESASKNAPSALVLLGQALDANATHTVETTMYNLPNMVDISTIASKCQPPINVRIIRSDGVQKDEYDRTVIVRRNAIMDWINAGARANIDALEQELFETGVLKEKKKGFIITKKIKNTTSTHGMCWILDLDKIEGVSNV